MKRVENISRTLRVGDRVRFRTHDLPKGLMMYAGKDGVVEEILCNCSYKDRLNACPSNTNFIFCPGRLIVSGVNSSPECFGYTTLVFERINI